MSRGWGGEVLLGRGQLHRGLHRCACGGGVGVLHLFPVHVHTCSGPEEKGRRCSQPPCPTVPTFPPPCTPEARADFGGPSLEAIRGLDDVCPAPVPGA